jgi:hypothetical protein
VPERIDPMIAAWNAGDRRRAVEPAPEEVGAPLEAWAP